MTDAEIIKALEYHKDESNKCRDCAYGKGKGCSFKLAEDTLELINRQKAEYKDLYKKYCELAKTTNERVPVLIKEVQKSKAELRAEAIKEFAERLKKAKQYSLERHENIVPVAVVDWIVKEMAGDTE